MSCKTVNDKEKGSYLKVRERVVLSIHLLELYREHSHIKGHEKS